MLPTHHGRGIGRALLELAERRAAAAGRTRVRLFTHVTMLENQRLYERIGYVETHRAGDAGLVRVFYEKSLTDAPPRSSAPVVEQPSEVVRSRARPTPR